MFDVWVERLTNLLIGFKHDEELNSNIRGINKLKDAIKEQTYINSAMFLYNNGNLTTSEKKEILNNVRNIYESLNYEQQKTKRY